MKTRGAGIVLCLLFISGIALAEVVRGIDIDFVTIGYPDNPGDTRVEANPIGCGAVEYVYRVGKCEITNDQWDTFVSLAGAPAGSTSEGYSHGSWYTGANIPANGISWYEAAQFCNYLTSGDKSLGAYLFSGDDDNAGDFLGIDRDWALSTYGTVYVIPNQDEWYKAAYYTGSDYSTYANGTYVAPIAGVDANYDDAIGQPWNVGSGTPEQNDTFDMMGNLYEWNENLRSTYNRVIRGGGCLDDEYNISMSWCSSASQGIEANIIGFRVVSIPEPATLLLFGLSIPILSGLKRKREK